MKKRTWIILTVILAVLLLTLSFGKSVLNKVSHIGEEPVQIFEKIHKEFDNEAIENADELMENEVAYFYINDTSNYEIVKIGLPVKTIEDYEEDSIYTVYLCEGNASNWKFVEDYELVIKANTYDEEEINEWVYFDVNIVVEEGQFLVFGHETDSINVAYNNVSTDYFRSEIFGTRNDKVIGSLCFDLYGYELNK